MFLFSRIQATRGVAILLLIVLVCASLIVSPVLADPPTLEIIGNKTIDELTLLSFNAVGNDTDGDTLTYTLSGTIPSGASINPSTGAFSWTPTEAQGPSPTVNDYTFDVCVDDTTTTTCETIKVTVNEVNQARRWISISNKSVNELALLTFTALGHDTDVPANPLSYSLGGTPPSGASIDPSTGAFSWTPTEAQGPSPTVNDYTFDACVDDTTTTSCETIKVTVNEVNQAPTLDSIGNKSVNELALLTFTALGHDTDVPANPLSYSLGGTPPSGASIDPSTGAFSWTPTEAQGPSPTVNDYTFNVCVSDGVASPVCETIKVTVNEVNQAPTLDSIGNKSVNELALLTFTALGHDTDVPANPLSYSLGGTPPSGASIDPSTGAFSWTPTEAQGPSPTVNDYTFDACVDDTTTTSCETIKVTVNEVNQAPTLDSIGNKSVNELALLTFTALGHDTDVPANPLSYSLGGTPPSGASIDPSTGAFSWTPTEAQGPSPTVNDYTFNVCVSDGVASPVCETIKVTVNEVNQAPTLDSIGNKSVNELALLTFTALGHDTDVPANPLSYSLGGTPPSGASIEPEHGRIQLDTHRGSGTEPYGQ